MAANLKVINYLVISLVFATSYVIISLLMIGDSFGTSSESDSGRL